MSDKNDGGMMGGPLLLRPKEAARLIGVRRSKFFEMDSAGKIPRAIRTLGARCPRWSAEDLREWVAAGCPDRQTWEANRRK